MEIKVSTRTVNSKALNNQVLNYQQPAEIRTTTSRIKATDRWDHFKARCGFNRGGHRVEPGLYALGSPSPDSPVFVSANYRLSFDKLRSALRWIDGYILVLDTRGVNVWCAAGKGTFGTEELVGRVKSTGLADVVSHRTLILPQLGAPGVAAHEVKKRSGFRVEYGPVLATDLPEYLDTHRASSQMRKVPFSLRDRIVLIPVELVRALAVVAAIAAAGVIFRESLKTVPFEAVTAIIAGVALFPILLPWIPAHDFSAKGFILGAAVVLPFAAVKIFSPASTTFFWMRAGRALAVMLMWPPLTSFISLNFTGSSTFTSRSGVRREIFKYTPVMAAMFFSGIVIAVVLKLIELFGG
jgi:hypothetical protein